MARDRSGLETLVETSPQTLRKIERQRIALFRFIDSFVKGDRHNGDLATIYMEFIGRVRAYFYDYSIEAFAAEFQRLQYFAFQIVAEAARLFQKAVSVIYRQYTIVNSIADL